MAVKIKSATKSGKQLQLKEEKGEGYAVIPRVIKGDTFMVLNDTQLEVEDEFADLYWTTQNATNVFVTPPFEPRGLMRLVHHNNILSQCIDAMEVNIDGTGFDMVPADGVKAMDSGEADKMRAFFNEPYPGKSMVSIRRALRRDLESIGWGFLEVLRAADGTIALIRNIPAWTVRYVRLDSPVMVEKTVVRNGIETKITLSERERRFGQKIGINIAYFREFGSSRQINKITGKWEGTGAADAGAVKPADRGAELLAFQVNPDDYSPYGLPRWINQLPSVMGSRKAEESNLEFFDSGGIPPAIIFVQGGTLAPKVSEQLRTYLSGQSQNRNRAVVVEAQASGGSIDGPAGSVQVRVERFGAERANDALFLKYDAATEEHVRTGFRLPPIFLGKAVDYNFATAKTAYMVAEAQVFQPERLEFDEVVNKTLISAMGCKTVNLKSMPITLTDVQVQLEGIVAVSNQVNGQNLVETVNDITGLSLKYEKPADPVLPQGMLIPPLGEPPKPAEGTKPVGVNKPAVAEPDAEGAKGKVADAAPAAAVGKPKPKAKAAVKKIMEVARQYAEVNGFVLVNKGTVITDAAEIELAIKAMDEPDRQAVYELITHYQFGHTTKSLTDIVAAACEH